MRGQSISHYEVLEKLGEGGMGAVYKARDKILDRLVALKVLLPGKSIDEDRKRRFVQEARAASALNHPNIITIYEISAANGVDFMAMEFVRGRRLDQVIGRKGLAWMEALKYAVQIADAVSAANVAGIVHRDLKPGNIMITEKGLVKVLDFGLAKLTEPAHPGDSEATQTVNLVEAPRTEEGMIVGTVAYMSPEQAEGKKVDARSDIFSFGSVLYEMITGHRAFHGDTKLSTLSAILKEEPAPVTTAASSVPRELARIIARCLRKDPARRFQLMDEVKIALEELKEESDSGLLAHEPSADAKPSGTRISVLIVSALVLLLAIGGGVWWRAQSHPSARRASAGLIKLTSDSGLTTDPALSPDGRLLAYASDRSGDGNLDIWVQQVATGESVRLTRHAADDYEPDLSPDNSRIAFRSDRDGGGIFVVSALGGESKPVVRKGRGAKFSPDGASIAYWVGTEQNNPTQIFIVPVTGGQPKRLCPDFIEARSPIWTLDGKRLLFQGKRTPKSSYEWWVTPIDGGEAVEVGVWAACRRLGLQPVTGLQLLPGAWTAGGDVIFSAKLGDSTNLWRVSISPRTWKMAADPERVTFGAGEEIHPSVSAGGHVVFASPVTATEIWSVRVDSAHGKVLGQAERITQDGTAKERPSLSADLKKLAFLSRRSGSIGVCVKDLTTGAETVAASVPANVMMTMPKISKDGSKVAYAVFGRGMRAIYVVSSSGGVPDKVCEGADCGRPQDWSSDGGKLLYDVPADSWIRFILLDLASGQKHELARHPNQAMFRPSFSPDGHWISFHARTSALGRTIYVAPVHEEAVSPPTEWISLTDGASLDYEPYWTPDDMIYFLSDRDGFRCIWALRLDPVTKRATGLPFPVLHFHNSRRALSNIVNTAFVGLTVTKDRIIYLPGEITANIWMAEISR